MTLWGKLPQQIEAERQEELARRDLIAKRQEQERHERVERLLNGHRSPEQLGAFYASHLPPDAPLLPARSADRWVDNRGWVALALAIGAWAIVAGIVAVIL